MSLLLLFSSAGSGGTTFNVTAQANSTLVGSLSRSDSKKLSSSVTSVPSLINTKVKIVVVSASISVSSLLSKVIAKPISALSFTFTNMSRIFAISRFVSTHPIASSIKAFPFRIQALVVGIATNLVTHANIGLNTLRTIVVRRVKRIIK